jgi:hypothetical protein
MYLERFKMLILLLFGVFWGMCEVNSCNVFPVLFMALGVPSSYLRDAFQEGSADALVCLPVPRA